MQRKTTMIRNMSDIKTIHEQIQTFPTGPGLYFMKGPKDEVLYIGKAKNLRSRVASYFQQVKRHRIRQGVIVRMRLYPGIGGFHFLRRIRKKANHRLIGQSNN